MGVIPREANPSTQTQRVCCSWTHSGKQSAAGRSPKYYGGTSLADEAFNLSQTCRWFFSFFDQPIEANALLTFPCAECWPSRTDMIRDFHASTHVIIRFSPPPFGGSVLLYLPSHVLPSGYSSLTLAIADLQGIIQILLKMHAVRG